MNEPEEGLVEATFVRREFYLQPPEKGASPEVWAAWLEADRNAARAAKASFTKAQKYAEIPEYLAPKVCAKVGGVWRQAALVGLVSDGDNTRLEAAIEADQDNRALLSPWERVGGRGESTKARSGSSKRAAAKARRKARKGQH